MIRLLIADDQHIVRLGLSTFMNLEPDIEVVGLASSGREAVRMSRSVRPDVVLMDVRMPDGGGLAATRALVSGTPAEAPKIIVITTFEVDEYVFAALDSGASGFLLKDAEPSTVADAVRNVAAGRAVISPGLSARVFEEFARRDKRMPAEVDHPLTNRELEVVVLLVRGADNRAIGKTLGLALSTVKAHLSNICSKLKVQNRVQVVVWALTSGVVTPEDMPPSARTERPQESL